MIKLKTTNEENNIMIGRFVEKNKKIFMAIMALISIFEGAMYIRGLLRFSMKSYKHYVYLYSYVFLFAISFCALIFLATQKLAKNKYRLCNIVIHLYSCAIVFWSMVISYLDMTVGNFPIVYLTVIVTVASVIVLHPAFFIAMTALSFGILYGSDGIGGFNYFVTTSEVINFTIFLSMVIIINLRLYSSVVRDYKSHELLKASVLEERGRVSAISLETIKSISNAVDAKDKYTREHSQRVAEYSSIIARKMQWSEEEVEKIHEIALLHDIGKIGVPDAILNLPGKLTEEEFNQMKQHTTIGGEILKDLTILPHVDLGAKYHHERYDGSGYPSGLKGNEIPLEARIIAVSDAFDAMNSNRVYRDHLSDERIIEELVNGKGKQFDPDIIDLFLPEAMDILKSK